jgi:YegS/Rv2252/BmrU family lipid kinase
VTAVAVVAHSGKQLGGGLTALRGALEAEGVVDPLWREVAKSRQAPALAREVLEAGSDVVVVWGGDGMVQRCADVLAGTDAAMAIVPAGTANLFASNLAIPRDIGRSVHVALHGARREIDVGRFNGEGFVVMSGVGWDAAMIREADGVLKDRVGRLAYVWTGMKHLRDPQFRARVKIDGAPWFEGAASSILVGNVAKMFGPITLFDDASPSDGEFEVGVVTASSLAQWGRALARTVVGNSERSPFLRSTRARRVRIKLDRKVRYELDGGDRTKTRTIAIDLDPGALTVCVPEAEKAR